MPETSLPFTTRLWFAWVCFFRVLFDGSFAARAWNARAELPPAPPAPPAPAKDELPPPAKEPPKKEAAPKKEAPKPEPKSTTAALQLLALLQREGRLIDFLEQDIEPFSDADIGSAVRVVHAGCRKALRSHVKIAPVRTEEENVSVTLPEGYNPQEIKLSGDVKGTGPYKGTLRHRGWRASDLTLPTPVAGHDPTILAPAEVEL
ncbi:MAG: DUF2760 domain-containing protein [Polyangiaceae bacterium]|nr:DUF2760 domain-containing protein [Polyangiaceae bacterium]